MFCCRGVGEHKQTLKNLSNPASNNELLLRNTKNVYKQQKCTQCEAAPYEKERKCYRAVKEIRVSYISPHMCPSGPIFPQTLLSVFTEAALKMINAKKKHKESETKFLCGHTHRICFSSNRFLIWLFSLRCTF